MGQKTNSTIFRVGIYENEWNSKYIEKNIEESSLYTFQSLEIKKYINRFFKINGLILHDYKILFSGTTLHIFISYYISLKAIFLINKINLQQKILLKKKKPFNKLKKTGKSFKKNPKKRLKLVKTYKSLLTTNKRKNTDITLRQNFSEYLTESLCIYTKNKYNINITFQNLNKGLSLRLKSKEGQSFRRAVLQLRQYSKNIFFKETINILLITILKKNSAKLLSEFLAFQLSIMKKQNFFFFFFKRSLNLFVFSKFSRINGIKVALSGRFNGAPRARKKIIQIGNIPLQTIKSKINYFQTTSFSRNGTFGVKIWICEN